MVFGVAMVGMVVIALVSVVTGVGLVGFGVGVVFGLVDCIVRFGIS